MRTNRPRRPGSKFGTGNPLDGVTSKFGLFGVLVLFVIGLGVQNNKFKLDEKTLEPIDLIAQNKPFTPKTNQKTILIPLQGGQVVAIDLEAYKAADTSLLYTIEQGTAFTAWLKTTDVAMLQKGYSSKDFTKVFRLQLKSGGWIIHPETYKKIENREGNQGLYLMIFALCLLPYTLVTNPRVPIWATLILFTAALLAWLFIY